MNFTYDQDNAFDEIISNALEAKCCNLTQLQSFKSSSIYIISDGKKVAGAIYYIYGETIWLDAIYVEDDFQKMGFGRKIIEKLIKISAVNGASQIQLNTYFKDSVLFFKKCGFDQIAIIPNWKYNLDCYLLRLVL